MEMANDDEKRVTNLYFPINKLGWTLKLYSSQPNNRPQPSTINHITDNWHFWNYRFYILKQEICSDV